VADKHLLERIGRDPEAGIREVMLTYGAALLGRLRRRAGTLGLFDEDAEEVFQDCLLRLVDPKRRMEVIAAGGSILPYLTRLGYWRLSDRTDAEERERSLEQGNVSHDPANPSSAARAVTTALQGLSPRDSLVLRLRYEEELGNAEVGEKLGITEGAAKKAAHDARERLRRELGRLGIDL